MIGISPFINFTHEPLVFPLLDISNPRKSNNDCISSKVKSFGTVFSFAISFSFLPTVSPAFIIVYHNHKKNATVI